MTGYKSQLGSCNLEIVTAAANNDLVLLDQILEQRQSERSIPLPDDEAFELFACEQVLRAYDLSTEEIEAGIVGGGGDGAIDGVYVFLGDSLLAEDTEVLEDDFAPAKIAAGSRLSLWIIQAKREESFTETAIDLVSSSTKRLLDLAQSEEDLQKLYSTAVVERVGLFRSVLQRLATRHLVIEIRFSYVTRGRTNGIHNRVERKARDLERHFSEMLPATGKVEFLGTTELWNAASSLPSYTLELRYQENATSGSSHVALVTLRDYLDFLTDDAGALRKHIFDWNVRDYQGNVEVNREIQETLADAESPEFWWLNNGVTIICSKTSIVAKTYILDDVQIVNGLQTSHALFRTLGPVASLENPVLDHSILVRILKTDDPQTRDAVIRATNHQTSVPAASLRATDEVQRSIEAFFLANGWYYDRRKNYYRNIGKSPERIISIPLLAQATMAMGLSRPDDSRARPSSLLKRDEDYSKMFSLQVPLSVYLWLAKAQHDVDTFLISAAASTTAPERTNLRFHLSMLAAAYLFGGKIHVPVQLKTLADNDTAIDTADLPARLEELRTYYREYLQSSGDTMDKAAKGSAFVDYMVARAFP